jgi:adenylate cyclase
LRGIDFVYSEPGVNRPLMPNDKEEFNLNRTNYRNQVNKAANAIKEIINGTKLSEEGNMPGKKGVNDIENDHITDDKSIAVLPFVNMSPDKDQEYFCDGVTEEIINALAHTEGFKVISRTSSFAFKDKNIDIREIGRILNVRNLLEGSIRKADNRLRITAQLIKVDDGSHIWSERYDREIKDIFAIQDEISKAIIDTLKVKLSGKKKSNDIKNKTENLEAFNLYLKGTFSSRMFTKEGFDKAKEYFEKALTIDPDYALPYVGLAEVLGFRTYWGNYKPSVTLPLVRQYIEKALKTNNTLAEAYSGLGNIYLFYDWNINESEQNFRYALQINPNSSIIHIEYAIFLRLTGRNEEAVSEALKAKELDPISWYIHSRAGDVFNVAGKIDKAIEEYRMSTSINPDYFLTHFQLGLVFVKKKMIFKAKSELEKAYTLSDGNPVVSAALYLVYFRMWKKGKAKKILKNLIARNEVEYIPPSCFFIIYNTRGEKEKAMDWLKRALLEHDTILPDIRISLMAIPGNLKYLNLMKEMGMDY